MLVKDRTCEFRAMVDSNGRFDDYNSREGASQKLLNKDQLQTVPIRSEFLTKALRINDGIQSINRQLNGML